jgi:two-component system sensor histidine kinase AlgZ
MIALLAQHKVLKVLKIVIVASLYSGTLYGFYQFGQTDLLVAFLTISLMVPIIFLINDRFKQQQIIDHLHQESLTAELNLLKSQINPHFFFNTLNNLYGLAVNKSDLTQDVIYKLSQMMRFTIYDGRKDTVSVNDEIAYLDNFIELNQIRHNSTLDINFTKNIDDGEQRIPPLLFINLLENAFKHGVDTQTEHQKISFSLTTSKAGISFSISNNFNEQVLLQNKKKRGAGGLGIENLKRRLALLFPNKHGYQVTSTSDSYTTQVTIDLT